jgi:16S rRNA G527 N7-methylase RsmG
LKIIENIWEELNLKKINFLHWRAEDFWQIKFIEKILI